MTIRSFFLGSTLLLFTACETSSSSGSASLGGPIGPASQNHSVNVPIEGGNGTFSVARFGGVNMSNLTMLSGPTKGVASFNMGTGEATYLSLLAATSDSFRFRYLGNDNIQHEVTVNLSFYPILANSMIWQVPAELKAGNCVETEFEFVGNPAHLSVKEYPLLLSSVGGYFAFFSNSDCSSAITSVSFGTSDPSANPPHKIKVWIRAGLHTLEATRVLQADEQTNTFAVQKVVQVKPNAVAAPTVACTSGGGYLTAYISSGVTQVDQYFWVNNYDNSMGGCADIPEAQRNYRSAFYSTYFFPGSPAPGSQKTIFVCTYNPSRDPVHSIGQIVTISNIGSGSYGYYMCY